MPQLLGMSTAAKADELQQVLQNKGQKRTRPFGPAFASLKQHRT